MCKREIYRDLKNVKIVCNKCKSTDAMDKRLTSITLSNYFIFNHVCSSVTTEHVNGEITQLFTDIW